jgi:hypothetical protein
MGDTLVIPGRREAASYGAQLRTRESITTVGYWLKERRPPAFKTTTVPEYGFSGAQLRTIARAFSPGDELAAPPAKEESALIRFSFGRFCIHCSTDVSFWPLTDIRAEPMDRLLSRAKRTWIRRLTMSANDPQRTCPS